jgi:hypothetical protein
VIGVADERLLPARILTAGAVETLDRGLAVSAVDPSVDRPELEVPELRIRLHGVAGGEQRRNIDTVSGWTDVR